jgi:hypothetical protein
VKAVAISFGLHGDRIGGEVSGVRKNQFENEVAGGAPGVGSAGVSQKREYSCRT